LEHWFAADAVPDCQFGFLPKRLTVWQLFAVLEEWEKAVDDGNTVHSCFLDVGKGFNRVDHLLLLAKIKSMGVVGIAFVLGDKLSWRSLHLD